VANFKLDDLFRELWGGGSNPARLLFQYPQRIRQVRALSFVWNADERRSTKMQRE